MMHTDSMRSHIANLKPELVKVIEQVLPEYTLDSKATGFDFIPDQYKAQVLQYFVVCDSLEVLYFSMFDPRVVGAAHHQVIPVYRKDITEKSRTISVASWPRSISPMCWPTLWG